MTKNNYYFSVFHTTFRVKRVKLHEPLSEVLVTPVSVTPAPNTLLILCSSSSVCAGCQVRSAFVRPLL